MHINAYFFNLLGRWLNLARKGAGMADAMAAAQGNYQILLAGIS